MLSKNYHYNNLNSSLNNLNSINYHLKNGQTNLNNNFNNFNINNNNINNSKHLTNNIKTMNNNLYKTKNNFFNSGVTTYQERIINFGQDSNENSFKKNLRKPILTNSTFNIITNTNNLNNSNNPSNKNVPSKFANNYTEKIEDIFAKAGNIANGYNNLNNNFNFTAKQAFNPIRTPSSNYNSQRTTSRNNLNEEEKTQTPRKELNNASDLNKFSSTFCNNFSLKELNNNNTNKDVSMFKKTSSDSFKSLNNENLNSLNNNNNNINFKNFYLKNCLSVKEIAYQEEQNSAYREYMEDRQKVIDCFMKDKNLGLFIIFDGHGGSKVCDYSKDRLPEIIEKLIKQNSNLNLENILTSSFLKLDEELKFEETEHVGSTVTLVLLSQEKGKRVLFCANLGDSRSVIVSSLSAKRLSYDHKATDQSEIERVRKSGGIIFNGRVLGQLMLTRALGDYSLKKQGVIATPFIQKHFLSDKDKYLVIASDGVWDVINDDEIFKFSLRVENADELAKIILKNALFRGSMDNISCLVIKLN